MIISKNNKRIVNILLVTALCFSIIGGTIFVQPVFANSNTPEVPYLNTTNPSRTDLENNGLLLFSGSYSNNIYTVYIGKIDENLPVYSGLRVFDNRVYGLIAFSSTQGSPYPIYYKNMDNSVYRVSGSTQIYTSIEGNEYRVFSFSIGNVPDNEFIYEPFSTIQDFVDSIEISDSSVISYENYVYIEPGYILFAVTEGGTLDLETTMPVNNSLNIVGVPWDSTSRIAFGVNRPTSGTQYNTDNFGSRINWRKAPNGNSNFIGLQKEAVAHYEDLPSDGSFVAIMNPAYYGDSVVNPSVNGYIRAKFSNGGAYVKYSMKTNLTLGLGGIMEPVITSDNGWSDGAIAIPTTNGAILDNDYIYENTSKPAVSFDDGGQNSLEDSNDDVQGIGGLLNRIIKFLSSPIEHIQNLFNAGSTFFGFLSSLWSWIPPEISSILVSAVIVLLVIGVIKVLWK